MAIRTVEDALNFALHETKLLIDAAQDWKDAYMKVAVETPFAKAVREEIERARGELKYPPMASLHEGYSVILEEVEEFWDEVKKKPAARSKEQMWKELVQISAMCQRTAEDLKLGGDP